MALLEQNNLNIIQEYYKKYILDNNPIPDVLPELRPEILESWKRCKELNVPVSAMKNSDLEPEALTKIFKENYELMSTAESYLSMLYDFVKGTNSCIQLCDKNGCVLQAFTDQDELLNNLASSLSNRKSGFMVSEELTGTNSSALCLKLKKPLQIIGPEHYRLSNQNFYCSSAPVFDKDQHLLGCITIMAPVENYQPHTLSTVCIAANGIEREMALKSAYTESMLTSTLLSASINSLSAGTIIIDGDKNILHYNGLALNLLNLKEVEIKNSNIYDIINVESIPEAIRNFDHDTSDNEITITNMHGDSIPITLDCAVVNNLNDGVKSTIISISAQTRRHSIATKVTGQHAKYTFDDIIGESPALISLKQLAMDAATSPSTVLITGESGTGKELIAQAIHNYSAFSSGPFIAVNCGALPKNLIESELFGYEYGAFSGANKKGNPGKFELADNGTIFLDEIGELPLELQATLLRVLQTKEVTRLGGKHSRKVNIKILAATNCDLLNAIRQNTFRMDLYYRLNVLNLHVPPLRNRPEDIPMLVQYFTEHYSKSLDKNIISIDKDAMSLLKAYSWPGNVRELENTIERAVNMASSSTITINNLPVELLYGVNSTRSFQINSSPAFNSCQEYWGNSGPSSAPINFPTYTNTSTAHTPEIDEYNLLLNTLKELKGHTKSVAEALNMPLSTLYGKLKKYGLNPKEYKRW